MSEGFSLLDTSQQDSVLSSWSLQSELVESQALTTSSDDSFSGLFSESEGTDSQLWDGEESDVVGDGGNSDNDGVVGLSLEVLDVLDDSGDTDWITIGVRLVKSLEDGFIEGRVSSSGQEFIESDQELVIRIGSS